MADHARAGGLAWPRVATALAAGALIASTVRAQDTVTDGGLQAAEVRAAFDAIDRAVAARDTARLAELVHPRFAMLHALGQVDSRDTWFALVKSGRLPRQTAVRRELQPEIVVAGNTALIRSLVQMTDTAGGRTSWMRSTTVFVRDGGRWLQVNQQSSYLHDGPTTPPAELESFAGTYAIPGREGFVIAPRDNYLELTWANGAVLPLLPDGPDRFAAGVTSSIRFLRDPSGRVATAERRGDDGTVWWIARRP